MLIGDLALVSAALFTGAAFYVNFAEQPARLKLDDQSLLAQWKPAYKRGYIMQSTLAIIGFVLGAAAWWLSGILAFLLGAVLMLANWPWTLFGIMPTNRILMATELQSAGSASRALLVKWNSLHAVRTGLGAAANPIIPVGAGVGHAPVELASCDRRADFSRPCGTRFTDLTSENRRRPMMADDPNGRMKAARDAMNKTVVSQFEIRSS